MADHDLTFHAAMSDPRVARDLFIKQYPSEVIAKFDLTSLTLCPETFVDEVLADKLIVDVLYQIKLGNSNAKAYIYVLTEAQAQAELMMPWRMVKYTVRIIEQHLKIYPNDKLPVILPIIFYHGKQRYHHSTNIFDLFNDPELAKAYMFNDMQLIDLSQMSDAEMFDSGYAGFLMSVMRYKHIRDFAARIKALKPFIEAFINEKKYAEIMLRYAINDIDIHDKVAFFTMVNSISTSSSEVIMNLETLARNEGIQKGILQGMERGIEKGKSEGIQQGIQEGIRQGLLEGERKGFLRRLQRRFKVSEHYLNLVSFADEDMLVRWDDNLETATNLEQVFN